MPLLETVAGKTAVGKALAVDTGLQTAFAVDTWPFVAPPVTRTVSVVGSVDTAPQQAVGTAVVTGNHLSSAAELQPVAVAAAGRDLGQY